ncbi:cation transporter [Phlyctema vagabunda]|uniref:Cation transporter n=1 Tax=Phlyctema vagabunda TaxID=108571 RepID=A0ABR4PP20_9HELO
MAKEGPRISAHFHEVFLPSSIARLVPRINFLTIHYVSFICTILLFSIIFWASSPQPRQVSYVNSLFMTASAMTETGLHTLNLSTLNTFQQVLLFILTIIGNPIFVSWLVVLFRKRGFEKKFQEAVQAEKTRREVEEDLQFQNLAPGFSARVYHASMPRQHDQLPGQSSTNDVRSIIPVRRFHVSSSSNEGTKTQEGHAPYTAPEYLGHRTQASSVYSQNELGVRVSAQQPAQDTRPASPIEMPQYSSLNPALVGHVHDLTREGRLHLGGVEYRAIRVLVWLIPLYLLVWQVAGCLCIALYISMNKSRIALRNGADPGWMGIFLAVSAFNNMGMSLLDQNMVPLNTNSYLILMLIPLMLAGNTAYPLFLRFTVSIGRFLFPPTSKVRPTLQFMLDHPRRVYTHLFPFQHSVHLFLVLFLLVAIDWISFALLNRHNRLLTALPISVRVFAGLFQALANRSAGFQLFAVRQLAVGFQVLSVLMMYASVYPVTMAMRCSNIYEERALGIFAASTSSPRLQNLRQQVRLQLSHDLWWLALCTIVIVIIESSTSTRIGPVFDYLFEIVSAYGPVGLSLGLPRQSFSFAGSWTPGSKVVLVAVMIRGRHRALPVVVDGAVMLPEEDEEGRRDVRGV